jgi:hypothetical protein
MGTTVPHAEPVFKGNFRRKRQARREGPWNLYQKDASRAGEEELLLKTPLNKLPTGGALAPLPGAVSQDADGSVGDRWIDASRAMVCGRNSMSA